MNDPQIQRSSDAWRALDEASRQQLIDTVDEVRRLAHDADLELDNGRPQRAVRDLLSTVEVALEALAIAWMFRLISAATT